jgi:hypothetical protein
MTTAALLNELNHLAISSSEDYAQLDRLAELLNLLAQNPDGYQACGALLALAERHPQVEFGAPGQLVHTLETYRGHYEPLLLASLERRPTATTIWLLNRLLNGAEGSERQLLIAQLKSLLTHPAADEQAQAIAQDFYCFQTSAGA